MDSLLVLHGLSLYSMVGGFMHLQAVIAVHFLGTELTVILKHCWEMNALDVVHQMLSFCVFFAAESAGVASA